MHDSEQEHSSITGCRVTYESTIFYNEANKFSIIVVKTNDPRIPPQACSGRYYGDRMLRFTAVGYELPRTKAVELELDGEWVESKYGYQLQVEQWQEIVPQTADGLLAYLGSGLIKGIGPKTAEDIVATFGPDTLNILDNEPEKLLQIRGITEGKLKDIEESYAESRVLRNLMSLLGPFKITPATALKIYQHFGPACVDILKKCPYDLCQISGFGFKRVDGIVRKTDNRLHSVERIKGAVLYTLEDARSKSGHLFLPSEDLVKETLLLLNAPIPIPEQRVRTEEVQETLQQMILHGAVVAYKQYLYSPRVFGQQYDTDRVKLILDPGLAFGTGGHETTSLCLEALDEQVRGGERVLDIGTGSGILAIAALKLGAASAEGVDIDPVAVRTAGENAALNGVQDKLTVLVGDLSDKASGTYDIITANIVANAILSLAPAVPGLMAEGATFIASGIIDSRKDEVIAGLEKAGLAVVEVKEKRGWECIVCKKA